MFSCGVAHDKTLRGTPTPVDQNPTVILQLLGVLLSLSLSLLGGFRQRSESVTGAQIAMDVIKTQQISARSIEKVIVHPLVLLSIVDNYNRVAKDTRKRVVGVLLGSTYKGVVDVSNSYAGPPISQFLNFLLVLDPPIC